MFFVAIAALSVLEGSRATSENGVGEKISSMSLMSMLSKIDWVPEAEASETVENQEINNGNARSSDGSFP
jgi:hypothetical protein